MNRPQNYQPQAPQMQSAPQSQSTTGRSNGGSRGFMHPSVESKVTLFLIIIAALVVVAGMAGSIFAGKRGASAAVATEQYQAVFLSNGQVYFGKLSALENEYVTLRDIYYPQFEEAVQPRDGEQATPNVTLAKLGNELHGPEDEMFINRDEVVFWENLKTDGQVAEAIRSYQSGQGAQTQQPAEGATEDTEVNQGN